MKLLIDADVLAYEAGFAAQKTVYDYKDHVFKDAKEAKNYCEQHDLDYRALRRADEIVARVEVMPEAAAVNVYRMKLASILNKLNSRDYKLLLSGDGNFRDKVGVTKKYKANRVNVPKPEHYLLVRNLILQDPRSELTVGVEADDAMGMYVTDDPSAVICSIDKDLNQIPCLRS